MLIYHETSLSLARRIIQTQTLKIGPIAADAFAKFGNSPNQAGRQARFDGAILAFDWAGRIEPLIDYDMVQPNVLYNEGWRLILAPGTNAGLYLREIHVTADEANDGYYQPRFKSKLWPLSIIRKTITASKYRDALMLEINRFCEVSFLVSHDAVD